MKNLLYKLSAQSSKYKKLILTLIALCGVLGMTGCNTIGSVIEAATGIPRFNIEDMNYQTSVGVGYTTAKNRIYYVLRRGDKVMLCVEALPDVGTESFAVFAASNGNVNLGSAKRRQIRKAF